MTTDNCCMCGATKPLGSTCATCVNTACMQGTFATLEQAKAAYEQFASEPDPGGFIQEPMPWEEIGDTNHQLWHRVATAALNGKAVSSLSAEYAICARCMRAITDEGDLPWAPLDTAKAAQWHAKLIEQLETEQEKLAVLISDAEVVMLQHVAASFNALVDAGDREHFVSDVAITYNWKCGEDKGAPDVLRSPVGYCIYDQANDPCFDCCIYCGDPDERK